MLSRVIALEKQLKLLQENFNGLTQRLAGLEGVNEVTPIGGTTAPDDTASDDSNNEPVKPVVAKPKPKAKPKPRPKSPK